MCKPEVISTCTSRAKLSYVHTKNNVASQFCVNWFYSWVTWLWRWHNLYMRSNMSILTIPLGFPLWQWRCWQCYGSVKAIVRSIPYPVGQLIADRGCGFTSLVMKKLCTDLEILYKYTSTHSPVGGVEIFNKYLITCLSLLKLKPERRLRWKRFLDPILYCFGSSMRSTEENQLGVAHQSTTQTQLAKSRDGSRSDLV